MAASGPEDFAMTNAAYAERLAADLPGWRERGWIDEAGAAAILASLPPRRPGLGLSELVATLGSVLLGLGAIALVAANWEAIPRFGRLVMLIAALAGAYGLAARLRARGRPALAEAALLVAGLVFGGSIALVGQSYHLAGEFADALLLYALGCLGAALLARSGMLAVLAVAGGAYWTGTVMIDGPGTPHLAGLALLVAAGAAATWLASRPARGLAIVAVGGWIVVALALAVVHHRWNPGAAVAVGIGAALALWALGTLLGALPRPRLAALGRDLVHPALAAVIAGLALLQLGGLLGLGGRGARTGELALPLVTACGLVGLAAALATAAARLKALKDAEVGALAALGAAAIAFVLVRPGNAFLASLVGAVLVLAGAMFAVWLGQAGRQAGAKRLGLTAFGLEVAYVYVVTLGTILDTALSLIAGGLLFIGLAALLIRVNRALAARGIGAAS
jgi:uncharacterized membrane protein